MKKWESFNSKQPKLDKEFWAVLEPTNKEVWFSNSPKLEKMIRRQEGYFLWSIHFVFGGYIKLSENYEIVIWRY